MPFKKNVKRERILLNQWLKGNTVKKASLLTNIPEGSISHYYARFNTNKDKYRKMLETGYQEPSAPSPFDVALWSIAYHNVLYNATQLVQNGKVAKARDYLQVILLLHDLTKRLSPIFQNFDPDKIDAVINNMMMLVENLK